MKTGTITKCKFTSEWKAPAPANSILYYHELTMDNGDVGNVATIEKYSDKIKEGAVIEYEIDDKKKIKIFTQTQNNPSSNGNGQQSSKAPFVKKHITKPDTFLGYAYAYAKDMVIAGKTTKKDRENLELIATEIYEAIKKKLKEGETDK